MKNHHYDWAIQLTVAALLAGSVAAQDSQPDLNRFSFSPRFGFNIGVTMKNTGAPIVTPPIVNDRRTPGDSNRPGGDPYNYDNGYIFPDISGSGDGMTWYWGYDDSASQVNSSMLNPGNFNSAFPDNSILLTRTTAVGSTEIGDPRFDNWDYKPGFELTYSRELGRDGLNSYGLEIALNYLNLCLDARTRAAATITTQTDAYNYTDGTTPPSATPMSPYQQSFSGPFTGTGGFILNTGIAGSAISAESASVSGNYHFRADLFGFRVGPYFDYPLDEKSSVILSAGFAVNFVNAEASWREIATADSLSTTVGAEDSGTDILWGGYVGGMITYKINRDWTAVGGVQWQDLTSYSQTLGSKKVELNMSNAIFFTLGVSYSF